MHWSPPSAAFFAQNPHRKPKDYPEPVVDVFPELWPMLRLYDRHRRQLRMGPSGPVGLDFNVFLHELDRMNLTQDDYDDYLAQLRMIEVHALNAYQSDPA